MQLVKASTDILDFHCSSHLIEVAGRTCYKSECKDDPDGFVRMIRSRNHESVLEHSMVTVRFVIDRGVSHELVRHRLCAFSQESTRYCNYAKKGVCFVIPPWIDLPAGEYGDAVVVQVASDLSRPKSTVVWLTAIAQSAIHYETLLSSGWQPQQARSVLPNSLKTEIVVTANAREWRHIFVLRTAKAAHPQMLEVMVPLLKQFANRSPALFGDIAIVE